MGQLAGQKTHTTALASSIDTAIAWRVILVAILSNLVFKAGCVYVLGSKRLRKWITLLFGLAMLGGILIICFWPDTTTITPP
jgi:uncharacterized membrane protein (DUF4010 family)